MMKHSHFKKIICMICMVAFIASLCTGASATEPDAFTASGRVVEPVRVTLTAPLGGQVQPFALNTGDAVEAEDTVLSILPKQVLAACDGIIQGMQAQVGDQATPLISIYGALCYIERDQVWQVEASRASAYNKVENRDVRIGDTLRIQQGSGNNAVTGMGNVIDLRPRGFVVEFPAGEFELESTVKFFQGDGIAFKNKDEVGSGKIKRPAAVPVLGDGCVAAVHVAEGQAVRRGQLLFTLDAVTAMHEDTPQNEVQCHVQGIIAEVLVQPGQFVTQGQAVMTLIPTAELNISLEVDELDIAKVVPGQSVRITLDAYGEQERIGTVLEINPVGDVVQDITKFMVLIGVEDTDGLMIGMHAKGFWGK